MTDPQDPPKPPIPAGGMTQQLVALVEEVPEEEGDPNEAPDVGDDAFPPEGGPITTSKAPPLLPKEKKQVRNRAVVIGVAVFVVSIVVALGAVFLLGGIHGTPQPVAQPTPPHPPTPPATVAADGTQPTPPHHNTIRLDEFVFTAGTDAGAPEPEAPQHPGAARAAPAP